jgi:hypothetical protein
MQIELSCKVCGGNRFDYPVMFAATSVIRCRDCGNHVGTVSEIQHVIAERLARRNVNMLAND